MKVELQIPQLLVPASDDGSRSEGENLADVRAALRGAVEELRARMERDERFLCQGRWRTPDEIRALRWQARKEDLARLRDIGLVLMISMAVVAAAYQLLLLLYP